MEPYSVQDGVYRSQTASDALMLTIRFTLKPKKNVRKTIFTHLAIPIYNDLIFIHYLVG